MKGGAQFNESFSVSRETLRSLEAYVDLLKKWNRTINLVSRASIEELWSRHISDSALAFPIANQKGGKWLDLGSGGGFPAVILSIIAKEKSTNVAVICVEADIRKCEFLRTVKRQLQLDLSVISRRIEDAPSQNADVITARALSDLPKLLSYAERHLNTDGICVFHKGKGWEQEVRDAERAWNFSLKLNQSTTSPDAALLEIKDIERV